MKYKILIIEDDHSIAHAILQQLCRWDMEGKIAEDFQNILEEISSFDPHLVLLDIRLPFYNGYHWCQKIRHVSHVPVIFISSAADSMNIVMAMNMGADDFIAKPFDLDVLLAKIQALLRRTYDFAAGATLLSHRGALLNTLDSTLTYEGQKIALSKNEYRILFTLLEHKGRVVSREKLMEALWATDNFVDENTLSVNVNRLRKHLDGIGLFDFISTQHGVGYILKKED